MESDEIIVGRPESGEETIISGPEIPEEGSLREDIRELEEVGPMIVGRPGEIPRPIKSINLGELISRESARTGGGIIGGLLAGTVSISNPLLTPVLVAAGVTAGATTGEAVRQVSMWLASKTYPGPEVPGTPKSVMEASWRSLKTGLIEGGLELGGAGLGRVVGRIGGRRLLEKVGERVGFGLEKIPEKVIGRQKRWAPARTPEAEEVLSFVDEAIKESKLLKPRRLRRGRPVAKEAERFEKYTTPLTPAETAESFALDHMQGIAESSVIGGGAIRKLKTARRAFFGELAADFIDEFAVSQPQELGSLLIDILKKGDKQLARGLIVGTRQFDTMVEGIAKVSTVSLKDFIEPIIRVQEKAGFSNRFLQTIGGLDQYISFKTAREIRNILVSRSGKIGKRTTLQKRIVKLDELLTEEMGNSLKQIKGYYGGKFDPYKKWQELEKEFKIHAKTYKNAFIDQILKKGDPELGGSPEYIIDGLFKPRGVNDIVELKNAIVVSTMDKLTQRETWIKLQGYHIQTIFNKSVKGDRLNGSALLKNLDEISDASLKEIYDTSLEGVYTKNPYNFVPRLRKFAKTLKTVQAKQDKPGAMYIQLMQGGAATGLVVGGVMGQDLVLGGSALVLLGPKALSMLLLSKTGMKLLTKGMTTPVTSPGYMGLVVRILAAGNRLMEGETKAQTSKVKKEISPPRPRYEQPPRADLLLGRRVPPQPGTEAKTREKGPGFLGTLKRPDGGISTELSIGVNIGGKETEIPLLVPTLTQKEKDHLLANGKPTKEIIDKAVKHSKKRVAEGKSPFFQKGEERPGPESRYWKFREGITTDEELAELNQQYKQKYGYIPKA